MAPAKNLSLVSFLTIGVLSVSAFAPSNVRNTAFIKSTNHQSSVMTSLNIASTSDAFFFADEEVAHSIVGVTEDKAAPIAPPQRKETKRKPAIKKKAGNANKHKEGIFSPLVYLSKDLMGEDDLNKLRAKIISMHSNVIKDFVDTSETRFGLFAMVVLFNIIDKNRTGTVEEEEMEDALRALGFSWLQEKHREKIFQRADTDGNGAIDFEEFKSETPKTLKANLVKLAKKNGEALGFLV